MKTEKTMSLEAYIEMYFKGNKAAYARSIDRTPQMVNQWMNDENIMMVGDQMVRVIIGKN